MLSHELAENLVPYCDELAHSVPVLGCPQAHSVSSWWCLETAGGSSMRSLPLVGGPHLRCLVLASPTVTRHPVAAHGHLP